MKKAAVQLFKLIFWPAITVIVLLALLMIFKLYPPFQKILTYGETVSFQEILYVAIWLTLAWLTTRLLEIFFWQGLIEKRTETKVPKLLKTILNAVVFLIIFFVIVGYIFHQSITGLIATTGVLGIVLGFGLRNTIESAFNGIMFSVDRIFQIGDMVSLTNIFNSPAKVVEMTWRYTIFQDSSSNLLIVPNNTIAASIVTNYSKPSHYSCFSLYIPISAPNVFIFRIKRILEAAMKSTNIILDEPSPIIMIDDIQDACIKYRLKYWIDIHKTSQDQAKNEMYHNILHHFAAAGIGLDITSGGYKVQAFSLQNPSIMTESILRETELFSELSKEEIKDLASRVQILYLKAGDVLIRQNDKGDSMFILAEGLLKVDIEDFENRKKVTVAKIMPGHFFGEMSLLVGDLRSASVTAFTDSIVYEINKETMQHLFEIHSNLIQLLSHKIAERHVVNLKKKNELFEKDVAAQTRNYTNMFYKMIRKWFWND